MAGYWKKISVISLSFAMSFPSKFNKEDGPLWRHYEKDDNICRVLLNYAGNIQMYAYIKSN